MALKVGGDTDLIGVSATGAADSITGLYKAGLSATEIFGDYNGYLAGTAELGGALRAAIDLAAASELDMVQASDLAAITLATFGGELETEAERAAFINEAMNNFVQTADASVAEVGDLAAAMANVGPTAAAFGWSLEDTNNALGILSTRGISGAEAGTALKSMMTNIMRPTDQVTEALNDLGVSLYDVDGNLRSLPEIVGSFETALSGVTEEQRNQYIQTLAGTYGMKAMNTLLAEGVDGWDEMAGAVGDAASISEVAAARTDTLAGKQEALKGALESVKIQIFEAIAPAVTTLTETFAKLVEEHGPAINEFFDKVGQIIGDVVDWVLQLVGDGDALNDWIGSLPKPIQELIAAFEDMVDKVKEALGIISGDVGDDMGDFMSILEDVGGVIADVLTEALNWLGEAALFVAEHWDAFKGALIAVGAVLAAGGIVSALGSIVGIIGSLVTGIGPIIALVGLLGAAWATDFGGMRTTLTEVWEGTIKPALTQLWEWLQVNIPAAIAAVSAYWNEVLLPPIQAVWGFIKEYIFPLFETLVGIYIENIKTAIAAWAEIWRTVLQPALATIWDFIVNSLIPAIGELIVWIVDKAGIAIDTAKNLWETVLKPALEIVWGFIQDHLIPLFESLWDLIKVAGGLALRVISGLWNNVLKPALEAVWAFIVTYLQPVFDALHKFWDETLGPALETLADKLKTILLDAWTKLTDALANAKEKILDPLKESFDKIGGAVDKVIGWVNDFKEAIANVKLPSWLEPGSPTPFELGLIGINKAMRDLANYAMPQFQAALTVMPAVSPVPAVARGTSFSVYGDILVPGVQDAPSLLAQLQELAA